MRPALSMVAGRPPLPLSLLRTPPPHPTHLTRTTRTHLSIYTYHHQEHTHHLSPHPTPRPQPQPVTLPRALDFSNRKQRGFFCLKKQPCLLLYEAAPHLFLFWHDFIARRVCTAEGVCVSEIRESVDARAQRGTIGHPQHTPRGVFFSFFFSRLASTVDTRARSFCVF